MHVVVSATRTCAAPREAILAFQRDPRSAARIEPRMRVSDVVIGPDGSATSWTTTAVLAKVVRMTFHTVVMAIDPVIVELRGAKQQQVSTVSVSAEPDVGGRFTLTYDVDVDLSSLWTARLQRRRFQKSAQKDVDRLIDAAVALIEADARVAGSTA
jgi:hypothetical protein